MSFFIMFYFFNYLSLSRIYLKNFRETTFHCQETMLIQIRQTILEERGKSNSEKNKLQV